MTTRAPTLLELIGWHEAAAPHRVTWMQEVQAPLDHRAQELLDRCAEAERILRAGERHTRDWIVANALMERRARKEATR